MERGAAQCQQHAGLARIIRAGLAFQFASRDCILTPPSRHALKPATLPVKLDPSHCPLRSHPELSRGSLPDLAPIRQTFTLTSELLPAFSHSSATLRAHTIQNARYHIGDRLDGLASHKPHMHLTNDMYLSCPRFAPRFALSNTGRSPRAKSQTAPACVPPKSQPIWCPIRRDCKNAASLENWK